MGSPSQASLLLQNELKDLCSNPIDGFSAWEVDDNNIFEWNVTFFGLPDTLYEGGFFNAIMSFPQNHPNSPPTVRFTSDIWHPKVDPDGNVCNSILHPPGDDPSAYKLASKRCSTFHTVENIVLSILSMLSSSIDESPAKVEAAAAIYNMSIPRKNSTACSCKDKQDFMLKSFTKQFKCDGCKQQGSGPRYMCNNCGFGLHEECMSPKATTSHEFFGSLEFQFFNEPQVRSRRCCDACGKRSRRCCEERYTGVQLPLCGQRPGFTSLLQQT